MLVRVRSLPVAVAIAAIVLMMLPVAAGAQTEDTEAFTIEEVVIAGPNDVDWHDYINGKEIFTYTVDNAPGLIDCLDDPVKVEIEITENGSSRASSTMDVPVLDDEDNKCKYTITPDDNFCWTTLEGEDNQGTDPLDEDTSYTPADDGEIFIRIYHYPSEQCGILEVTKMIKPATANQPSTPFEFKVESIAGCPTIENFTLYGDQSINIPVWVETEAGANCQYTVTELPKDGWAVEGDNPLTYQFKEENEEKWLMFTNTPVASTTTTSTDTSSSSSSSSSSTSTGPGGHRDGYDRDMTGSTYQTASTLPAVNQPGRLAFTGGGVSTLPLILLGLGTLLIGTAMSRAIRPGTKR